MPAPPIAAFTTTTRLFEDHQKRLLKKEKRRAELEEEKREREARSIGRDGRSLAKVLADQEERPSEPEDVSVFPIGIPMLAGPGSIATAMLYMSNETNIVAQAVILSAIALNLLLCMVIFLTAGPLMRFLGDSISAATTRILGVILSALSVQLLVDGIRGAFNLA